MQGVSINYFIIIIEFFANFISDTNTLFTVLIFQIFYYHYKNIKTFGFKIINILL